MQERICQSCAMPMPVDELLGTNADGSKNQDYCKHCYKDGAFFKPEETMEEMIESCVPFLVRDEGMEEEEARELLNNVIPKLKRWQ